MPFSSESSASLAILLNSAKIFYTLAFMPFRRESCGKK